MGLIYKITNSINDKVYIGQTKRDLEVRRNEYYYAHANDLYETIIYMAFAKYGIGKFLFSVVEDNIEESQLDEREIMYIKQYNALVPHGYNTIEGGRISGVKKMGESNAKAVYQINPENFEIISEASGLTEMALKTGISLNNISRSCLKKVYSTQGYIFRFKDNFDIEEVKAHYSQRPGKPVRCYKKFTNENLGEFHSIAEASRKLGLHKSSISENCYNRVYIAGKIDGEPIICDFIREIDKEGVYLAAHEPIDVSKSKPVLDAIEQNYRKMLEKFGE